MFLKTVRSILTIASLSMLTACIGGSDSTNSGGGDSNLSSSNSYKIFLDVAKDKTLVAYDMKLQFKKELPNISDITIERASFAKNGRTVSLLGPKQSSKDLILSFGIWSKGKGDGVAGSVELMSFKSKDLAKNITVSAKNFVYSDGKSDSTSSSVSIVEK